jgi:hypothetical protein
MSGNSIEPKKYELSGTQIKDIAECYAYLALLSYELKNEAYGPRKVEIARTVINEVLPLYRDSLPKEMSLLPRQQVNPDALEQTCKEILERTDNSAYLARLKAIKQR